MDEHAHHHIAKHTASLAGPHRAHLRTTMLTLVSDCAGNPPFPRIHCAQRLGSQREGRQQRLPPVVWLTSLPDAGWCSSQGPQATACLRRVCEGHRWQAMLCRRIRPHDLLSTRPMTGGVVVRVHMSGPSLHIACAAAVHSCSCSIVSENLRDALTVGGLQVSWDVGGMRLVQR